MKCLGKIQMERSFFRLLYILAFYYSRYLGITKIHYMTNRLEQQPSKQHHVIPSPVLYCSHFIQFLLSYVVPPWQRESRMGQTKCHFCKHPQEVAHSLHLDHYPLVEVVRQTESNRMKMATSPRRPGNKRL